MPKFVILTGAVNAEQEAAVLSVLQKYGMGWWHRLPGSWLVAGSNEGVTPHMLRDDLVDSIPGVYLAVLGVQTAGWGTFGPVSPDKPEDSFANWLQLHW